MLHEFVLNLSKLFFTKDLSEHQENIVVLAGAMDNCISVTEISKNKFPIATFTRNFQL